MTLEGVIGWLFLAPLAWFVMLSFMIWFGAVWLRRRRRR